MKRRIEHWAAVHPVTVRLYVPIVATLTLVGVWVNRGGCGCH